MANEVKIIVSATDKASATLSGVGNKLKSFTGGLNSAVQGLTGFSIGGIGAVGAVVAVGKAVGDSIKLFTSYAEQVRTMSAATGMSNEETSKMIQMFDDANVEIGLFTAAARKMIQNGIQPSIENMAKLADEYVALQDPVAKSKLLLDNFGKSGLAMGKLMAGGAEGIRKSAEAAEKFGLVLDDKAIEAAENYRKSLDDLGDSAQGVKIKIGQFLIPALNDAVSSMNSYIGVVIEHAVAIDELDKALELNIITQEEYNDLVLESAKGTKTVTASEVELAGVREELDGYTESLVDHSRPIPGIMADIAAAEADAAEAASAVASVYSAAIKALADSNVPLAEKNRLLREFAVLSGKTTAAEQEQTRQVNIATLAYEAGALSESAYNDVLKAIAAGMPYAISSAGNLALGYNNVAKSASAAAIKARELARAIAEIKDKTVTLTVQVKTAHPDWTKGLQFGGPVVGGRPYIVGEAGPELFVPGSSGKIVPNNQLKSGGGSGVTIGEINVYASESMDEQSLAQLVIARLAAATRNSGYAGLDYAG